jgi:YgiT-type zinc finger domain-containing protein
MYDYGDCVNCYTHLKEENIQQDFWIKNKLIVIENVPAGVCPRCRKKVVKADAGEHIFNIVKDNKYIAKAPAISIPVVKFKEEAEVA